MRENGQNSFFFFKKGIFVQLRKVELEEQLPQARIYRPDDDGDDGDDITLSGHR